MSSLLKNQYPIAFYSDFSMRDIPRTPHQNVLDAQRIDRQAGLHHVYVGNVNAETGNRTCYLGCGIKALVHDWYTLSDWRLDASGHCTDCGITVAGVFGEPPRTWGAKHQPVWLQLAAAC